MRFLQATIREERQNDSGKSTVFEENTEKNYQMSTEEKLRMQCEAIEDYYILHNSY